MSENQTFRHFKVSEIAQSFPDTSETLLLDTYLTNEEAAFAPGDLLFFKRRTVHALPNILEEPVVFLSVDTPRRDPKDIIFVNPEDGTSETFIGEKKY